MKKVLFTAMAALAMFAMVACNNKKAEEPVDTTDATMVEQCEHKCMHEGDSAMCCKAEGMAMDSTKACCKEQGKECCKKAEGQQCEKKCEKKCEKAQ